jgi:2-polyprenyl-3-methyl-5-hydroxy-6-metoxy-1,4-benzoquinol methylase
MSYVKCHLCGADDSTVVFPKGYAQLHQIVKCNRCGLMYSNPQELIDCERFNSPEYPKVFDPAYSRIYFQKQHVQLPDNARALEVLNGYLPKRGRLLEIGCYVGIFLSRMQEDGWDVTGLEPETAGANYARATYGLNVIEGLLNTVSLPEHHFDAAMMLHVIEHMPEPNADLKAIHRTLKPGGVLVVETPRFDSLMFRLFKHRERSIQNCNGHVLFFTVPTLSRLLEKNGFEILRVDLVGRTLTLERLMYNVALMTRSQRVQNWCHRMAPKLGLNKVRLHVNARDMQRIYCRARPVDPSARRTESVHAGAAAV